MINSGREGRNRRNHGFAVGAATSLAAGVLAGAGIWAAVRHPLPRVAGTLKLPGLHNAVEVLRDRWGVPHIYAAGNHDLFMALGYVHAQDRLWQMELNRRTGHGRLAEVFGPVALDSDRFMRVLGFSRVAQQEYAQLDDEIRTLIEAYTQGINAFLDDRRHRLPLEFHLLRFRPQPWQAVDVLVWGKIVALYLCGNWGSEILNARIVARLGAERARTLLPRYPDEQPITVPRDSSYRPDSGASALQAASAAAHFLPHPGAGQGSNAWAVSGARSTTGKPLLANDPHLGLTLPSIWYEAHLEGGDFAVTGATFPGVPGVVIGHNARIAWGITNARTDVQDLYSERFHPNDPLRYAWRDGWETVEIVREEIRVKGQPRPVIEEVRLTRHGPLITPVVAPPDSPLHTQDMLALRWTALEPGHTSRAIVRLNRAHNWDDFCAALADWCSPPQNFIYADVDGHYGYLLAGRLPIREQGDGQLPIPGWTGNYEWRGYIPPAALPAAYDPPQGLVINANNRIFDQSYAHHDLIHGEWMNGYRAARIQALLEATALHDRHSFARIQCDQHSLPGLELARLLAQVPLHDPLAIQARDLLVAWDGELAPASVGATIYATFRHHLERCVYADLAELRRAPAGLGLFSVLPGNTYLGRTLPGILAQITAAQPTPDAEAWPGAERTWVQVLQACMALTVAELRQRLGHNPHRWQYGRWHRLTLRHGLGRVPVLAPLFNRGSWPVGGDLDSICMGYIPRDTAVGPVSIGPSYRQICDLSNWDASLSVLAGGQSGHPGSRHYADLVALWRAGSYHPLLWSRPQVERFMHNRLTLEPQ